MVDDFVANVADDSRINGRFATTDIQRLKQLLVEQICAGTGGPCIYTGRDMKTTHAGMGITDAEFVLWSRIWFRAWTSSRYRPRRRRSCSASSAL